MKKAEAYALTARVRAASKRCKAAFDGEDADVIGASLAHLVSAYLMGFPDREFRRQTMERWIELVMNILEVFEKPGGRVQ